MDNTLRIENLTKKYKNGVLALDNVSLTISNGMFGILGPNGAGKSTLMRTIATLQSSTSGLVSFNDNDIFTAPFELRSKLGYLPQEFDVYPRMSAQRLLNHIAVLKGIGSAKERKSQIDQLLHQTNLSDARNRAVKSFSGGMKQRFGIAQALLGDPKLIIVDEPTAGLDPEERNRFLNLLSEIGEQIIVLLSTHIVEDVSNLCTDMAIMDQGKILAHGHPIKIMGQIEGCIWKKDIQKSELENYRSHYHVLSSKLNAGENEITVYSKTPLLEGFQSAPPQLEDFYFATLTGAITPLKKSTIDVKTTYSL